MTSPKDFDQENLSDYGSEEEDFDPFNPLVVTLLHRPFQQAIIDGVVEKLLSAGVLNSEVTTKSTRSSSEHPHQTSQTSTTQTTSPKSPKSRTWIKTNQSPVPRQDSDQYPKLRRTNGVSSSPHHRSFSGRSSSLSRTLTWQPPSDDSRSELLLKQYESSGRKRLSFTNPFIFDPREDEEDPTGDSTEATKSATTKNEGTQKSESD